MMDTEQQILDVALTVFSHDGYLGSTAKFIAYKSGFSELTLFRKFKNKENLFNSVLNYNNKKFEKEYNSIFINKKFKNKQDFLKTLITDIAKLIDDNIEYIRLILLGNSISDPVMVQFTQKLSDYLNENIQEDNRDYSTYSFILISSLIMFYNDEYLGHGSVNNQRTLNYLTERLSQLI